MMMKKKISMKIYISLQNDEYDDKIDLDELS